ncbi:unnamed protein product [Effrenium voratum]|nr:unnamed protein product [Effrenium voratum]
MCTPCCSDKFEARFLAKLHRRRFERARAAHPWQASAQLADVLTSGGLALGIGVHTGMVEVLALSACSQAGASCEGLPALRALYPGYIYVHGGYDGQRRLQSIERLAPAVDCWEPLPPMSDRRAVVTASGKLYVCGGWDGEHRLSQVERYNIATACWEQIPPMLERRSHPAVATLRGRLYVCGGFDGVESLSSVECFDPSVGRWSCLPQMRERRRRAIAVVMAGKLYICGGFDGAGQLNFAECYDPEVPQSAKSRVTAGIESESVVGSKSVLHQDDARYDPKAAVWEAARDCAVCGGFDGDSDLRTAEYFDPSTGDWMRLAPMQERRSSAVAVAALT